MEIIEALQPLATDIDSVKLDPKNARTGHAIGYIERSLEKYGQRKPIVVNLRTGTIEAGNGTWQAAKNLGWKQIAAVMVEDDAETATGFAIADNRLGDISFFDPSSLLEILNEVGDPLDIPGVSADWLESFESSINIPDFEPGSEDDQGKLDELEPKWVVCPGCNKKFDLRKHLNND